jgi:hypothetical protein
MSKTTITLETHTRDKLLQIGHKSQTYDELINELILNKEKINQSGLRNLNGPIKRGNN